MTHKEAAVRRDKVIELVKEELSDPEIAKMLELSVDYVKRIRTQNGIYRQIQVPTASSFLVLYIAVNERISQRDIAKRLFITRQRVNQILKSAREGGWSV